MKNVYPNLWTTLSNNKHFYEAKPIVTYGNEQLTHAELCTNVRSLATFLNKTTSKSIVAIDVSHPFATVISLLAVLVSKKGFWLVNATICDLVGTSILKEVFTLNNSEFEKGIKETRAFAYQKTMDEDAVFCWATSSGSSSVPKITEHSYCSIMEDTLRQIATHKITSTDRIDVLSALSFSASLASIFPVLFSGASLHIKKESSGIQDIYDFWIKEKISMTTMIPSLYRSLLRMPVDLKSTAIRFICLSGEKVSLNDFKLFQERFPSAAYFQAALASSETRAIAEFIGTIYTDVTLMEEISYHPVKDKKVLILDETDKEIGENKIGKIAVLSKVIGSRYVNSETSFKEKDKGVHFFVSSDVGLLKSDGSLIVRDSKLRKTKFKGEFIDLDVLENAIMALDNIGNCCVFINELKTALHVFVQTKLEKDFLKNELKTVFGTLNYQLFTSEKEFPQLYSGKIDTQELYDTWRVKQFVNDFSSPEEEIVYGILKKIFPSEDRFNGKHFFDDLGGDSMGAAEFSVAYCNALGIDFDPKLIYAYPVYEDLVAYKKINEFVSLKFLGAVSGQPKEKLLIFSGSNGNYTHYTALIKSLEKHFDIYVLLYSVIAKDRFLSVEEIAKNCSQFLNATDLKFQGIIGYSFAGLLAYQTATKYDKIQNLYLIDTPTYEKQVLVLKMYKRLTKSVKLGAMYIAKQSERDYLNDKIRAKIKLRFSKSTSVKQQVEIAGSKNFSAVFFNKISKGSQKINRSKFCLGVFVASRQNSFGTAIKSKHNWEKYNSNIVFKKVLNGSHMDMLKEESVLEIKKQILKSSQRFS